MRYFHLFLICLMVFVAACKSHKFTATQSNNSVYSDSSVSKSKCNLNEETIIEWVFEPDDTIFHSFFPHIDFNDTINQMRGKSYVGFPKKGILKITTSKFSSEITYDKNYKYSSNTKHDESYNKELPNKNNNKKYVIMSVLLIFICLCVRYRKKITKIFGVLKKFC